MKLKKELPLIAIVLLPIVYLAYVWNDLPNKVPVHWNLQGEVNRYGDKTELVLVILLLPVLTYFLLLLVPKIDPKNKLQKMGGKYDSIRFLLTTFVSILALFIIYSANSGSVTNPNYLLLGVGLLYFILGNYFKTIKANYFIGIRTPWTLENEEVWKATHKLAGKMWFIGGIMVVLSCLIFEKQINFIVFMSITLIISLVPVIYSFLKFRKLKNQLS
ncbi:SdpI family protein [Marivirga salinae]|uniref:SdpI family protein n=1 Tax=Marivirga salinarum TaxID=3059078 RepID=A0AA51NAD2_9BACT|nr:SdpI family protein [Marivirga sp. BDSF4-3]WMN11498.1 SdpI family protein [Marivirga sp. BDSF4-3]